MTSLSNGASEVNAGKDTSKTATTVVKSEKRAREADGSSEYDEWAKKLVNRPIPQLQPSVGFFQSGNSTFLIQGLGAGNTGTTACVGGDGLPPHNGYDMDSAIGRFTWITFEDDKYVPAIYRSGDLYCCVRMAEPVLNNFMRTLPPEIASAVILDSHNLTQTEAKLLTYINSWHCDGFYGAEPFTCHDLVVKVPELEKYYAFLNFAYQVLQSGGGNKADDFSKCGFVKVNQDSLIPYTVMSGDDKGIPLFYFEGQIDILNAKSQFLSGWELAYLKLCCKVQGVRKDLISGETLRIVKLVDLKGYFPKRTIFLENNWPPSKSKSLLPKQPSGSYQLSAATQRWTTRTLPNDSFDKARSNSSTLTTRSLTNFPFSNSHFTSTAGIHPPTSTSTSTNVFSHQGLNGVSRNGFTLGMSSAVSSAGAVSSATPSHNSPYQSVLAGPTGGQMQIPRNQIVAARTMNLGKFRVTSPPADTQKLSIIPEFSVNVQDRRDPPYSVRMIIIDKEVMHCINQKPHKSDVYLLVLQEFLMRFFPTPQISIYPTCVSVLKSIGVTTYLPNSAQIRVFNAFGFSISKVWELPLITATDAASQLNKLKTLLTPKPTMGHLRSTPSRVPPIPSNNNKRPIL